MTEVKKKKINSLHTLQNKSTGQVKEKDVVEEVYIPDNKSKMSFLVVVMPQFFMVYNISYYMRCCKKGSMSGAPVRPMIKCGLS